MNQGFVLVTTDSDFERLVECEPGARVVVLRACDYPTSVAAEVLRRNAIRVAATPAGRLIILERWLGEPGVGGALERGQPKSGRNLDIVLHPVIGSPARIDGSERLAD